MRTAIKWGKIILDKIYFPFLIDRAINKFQTAKIGAETPEAIWDLTNNFYYGPEIRGFNINLRPAQIKSEFLNLLKKIKNFQPLIMLEIGTATGGTLFSWSQILPDNATIISIDLPFGKFGAGYLSHKAKFFKSFAPGRQKIELIRADSHQPETIDKLKNFLAGRQLDFLFIDGDHTYEGAKQDFNRYRSFVRPGGLIALHDIAPTPADSQSQVAKLWAEIKTQYQTEEYINNPGQNWAGIGVVYI